MESIKKYSALNCMTQFQLSVFIFMYERNETYLSRTHNSHLSLLKLYNKLTRLGLK